jgi:hypothetical protein
MAVFLPLRLRSIPALQGATWIELPAKLFLGPHSRWPFLSSFLLLPPRNSPQRQGSRATHQKSQQRQQEVSVQFQQRDLQEQHPQNSQEKDAKKLADHFTNSTKSLYDYFKKTQKSDPYIQNTLDYAKQLEKLQASGQLDSTTNEP